MFRQVKSKRLRSILRLRCRASSWSSSSVFLRRPIESRESFDTASAIHTMERVPGVARILQGAPCGATSSTRDFRTIGGFYGTGPSALGFPWHRFILEARSWAIFRCVPAIPTEAHLQHHPHQQTRTTGNSAAYSLCASGSPEPMMFAGPSTTALRAYARDDKAARYARDDTADFTAATNASTSESEVAQWVIQRTSGSASSKQ
jgi:hypothetical protein